jgi:hypothetical protein
MFNADMKSAVRFLALPATFIFSARRKLWLNNMAFLILVSDPALCAHYVPRTSILGGDFSAELFDLNATKDIRSYSLLRG